jgi:phosphotransferase system HPr (HPr) family protein
MEYTFNVKIPDGMHARPCARLVEILSKITPIEITGNGKTIKTLSILELLLLKIPSGSEISIVCNHPLPPETLTRLNQLFNITDSI